jgi:hypothetical protein
MLSFFADAQTYIDEDFLDNLEKNARPLLEEKNAAFKEDKTPAKWDNESAVVIGYSRSVLFDRQSRGGFLSRKEKSLWFVEKDRFKIKLNDNNSVEAFSEIYFRYGTAQDGFIARIIKEDGSVDTIDLKNAVGVESVSDVPEYFKSFFDRVANSEYNYYKTPVAGLEPGDILEYIATTRSKLDVTASGYIEFSPVYEVCSKQYPVMYNEIIIETDDRSFFKYLSLNGAPKFTKENASDKEFFRYVFVDKNRETENDVNFVSPFLQYPMVKFQVIYSNNDQAKGALIGEKGELKTEFSRDELARKAWEDYQTVGDMYLGQGLTVQSFINRCWTELVKLGAKNWSESDYINKAYYLLRNKIVFRDSYLSDKVFAYIFGSLLYQRDIKSDIVISISNNIGKLNEVLFDEEIKYAIKTGDKLYCNLTDFSNPGDIPESLLDNEAYILSAPPKKSNIPGITTFTFPGSKATDNVMDVSIKAELSADLKNLMVIRTTSYQGLSKAKSSPGLLKYTPYMFDDYKHYGGNQPTENMKSKQVDDYTSSVKTLKDEFKKQKVEAVKTSLESEFGEHVQNIHFDVVTDGRDQKKKVLTVKEGFELTSFVRKAGKKYLVNLAGLMGSQLQIKKDERDRTHDIDVRYPKTSTWTISFKIPEGYTAEGLTDISKSVDNETGSFSLTAKEDNGFVVMNISKVYKQKNISKDKWQDMLSFIDAAYNSSYKYILLTPKQ